MTEKVLYSWLMGSDRLANLVGDRVYTGHAPQKIRKPYVVIRMTGSERINHLQNESDIRFDAVEVRSYSEESDSQAEEIAEAVRLRLSGLVYTKVDWKDRDGRDRESLIHEATIGGMAYDDEPPMDASDNWTRELVSTYTVGISQEVPDHL